MILKTTKPNKEIEFQIHSVDHNCYHYIKIITEKDYNEIITRLGNTDKATLDEVLKEAQKVIEEKYKVGREMVYAKRFFGFE